VNAPTLDRVRPATTGCSGCPSAQPWREGSSGEYVVIGRDDRVRVPRTTAAPFRYICNLERDGWAMCSGTLIGPSTVLTAGHCLVDRSGRALAPSRLRVIPGRNGALEPLPAARAGRILLLRGFRKVTPTDLGLIHLTHPIGRRVGWWHRQHRTSSIDRIGTSMSATLALPAGTLQVNVSGYPADMPATRRLGCRGPSGRPCDYSGVPSAGRNQSRCGTEQWRDYDKTVQLRGGMLAYLNDTCAGHSGSPVWVRRHPSMGGRVLVGVHVGAARDQRSNLAVHFTPAILRWIAANTR
jgi:V8-like Glu-specific endopeptidase